MKLIFAILTFGLFSVSALASDVCSYSQDGIRGRDALVEREIQSGELCVLVQGFISNIKDNTRLEEKYGRAILDNMHINFVGRETAMYREIMYLNVAYPTTKNYTILRRGSVTYWSDGGIDINLY